MMRHGHRTWSAKLARSAAVATAMGMIHAVTMMTAPAKVFAPTALLMVPSSPQ